MIHECDGAMARERVAQGALLLDVRTREEYATGHLEGALNLPLQELPQRQRELARGRELVLYCQGGVRSARAARLLEASGFGPLYDLGAIGNW